MVSKNERLNSIQWILLRGLSREQRHWGTFLDHFKTQFGSSNVTTLDLPGFGTKNQLSSPTSIEKIAKEINQDIKSKTEDTQACILVGLSLGGMVGLECLHQSIDSFAGAVIINSSSGGILPFYRRLNISALLPVFKDLVARDYKKREKAILHLTSNSPQKREEFLESWYEIQRNHPVKRRNIIKQIQAGRKWRCNLSRPREFPLLFVQSEKDRLVDPDNTRLLHEKLGGKLVTHPDSGHDLVIDDSQWLIEQVETWYREHFS